jgi:hypothetical protein
VVYIEEKGVECVVGVHRRNHTLPRPPRGPVRVVAVAKAS